MPCISEGQQDLLNRWLWFYFIQRSSWKVRVVIWSFVSKDVLRNTNFNSGSGSRVCAVTGVGFRDKGTLGPACLLDVPPVDGTLMGWDGCVFRFHLCWRWQMMSWTKQQCRLLKSPVLSITMVFFRNRGYHDIFKACRIYFGGDNLAKCDPGPQNQS